MALKVFCRWLSRLKSERITLLRLTGGEPLLVEDVSEYLKAAKDNGFFVTLNTSGAHIDDARLAELIPLVDCLKLSLPAPDAEGTKLYSKTQRLFERKMETAVMGAAQNVAVEFLTPMLPEAIRNFDNFADLLGPLNFIRWVPLRAEASKADWRPVNHDDMLQLCTKIAKLRGLERWENLKLYLAVPFCLLDSPIQALELLDGRKGCGPLASLVIDPDGNLMRCYSRRQPLDISGGVRAASFRAVLEDFASLPVLCQTCPVGSFCLGGCRCSRALTEDRFDYLARPTEAAKWQNNLAECLWS
jgi:radical SAM protein with 4Fe4S-binding SPASM domain